MQKAVADFLFGLCFGIGFAIAQSVLHLVAMLIGGAK